MYAFLRCRDLREWSRLRSRDTESFSSAESSVRGAETSLLALAKDAEGECASPPLLVGVPRGGRREESSEGLEDVLKTVKR